MIIQNNIWEMYNADVIVQCSQIEKINLAKWEGNMFRYQFAVFYWLTLNLIIVSNICQVRSR